jgi:hypothetical protein
MIVVHLPLYSGVKGDLNDSIRGFCQKHIGHPVWITPDRVSGVNEVPIFAFRIVPKLDRYEDIKVFDIWDKSCKMKPIHVAKVTINCNDDTYAVELSERYMTRRLNMTFHLHATGMEPHQIEAFNNGTHHGDWNYRLNI